MEHLPTDVLGIIYSYIPISTTYKLNKSAFIKNYRLLVIEQMNPRVRVSTIDNYMRYLIRKNCYMHLEICLAVSPIQWSRKWWKYKRGSYPNYMSYLKSLTIKYNKNKCREIIEGWMKRDLVSNKKRHKKIRSKNIKWSN